MARYPRSGYCDNALLAAGNLYREMASRFRSAALPRGRARRLPDAGRRVPSSRLGDDALWAAVEIAQDRAAARRCAEAARAYLDTYPEGGRAAR